MMLDSWHMTSFLSPGARKKPYPLSALKDETYPMTRGASQLSSGGGDDGGLFAEWVFSARTAERRRELRVRREEEGEAHRRGHTRGL